MPESAESLKPQLCTALPRCSPSGLLDAVSLQVGNAMLFQDTAWFGSSAEQLVAPNP